MSTDTTEQTPAQQRLAAARAELAEQQAAAATEAPTITIVEPGTTVHTLVAGLTVNLGGERGVSSVVLSKGDQFVVTREMIERTRNRLGELGGVSLAADEDEQIRRWGRVHFRVGERPSDLTAWEHGSADWTRAREAARQAAWQQPTDAARADALAELERVFGPAAPTSVTTNAAPNKSIAEAAVQAERLAARSAQGTR